MIPDEIKEPLREIESLLEERQPDNTPAFERLRELRRFSRSKWNFAACLRMVDDLRGKVGGDVAVNDLLDRLMLVYYAGDCWEPDVGE